MSLCSTEIVVNSNGLHGEAASLRCKRWSCPNCAGLNRLRVMHAARKGEPNLFLTLTCRPGRFRTPSEAARDMKRGLVLLRRRIARKWGVKNLPFIVVYEATENGWPHMHLLLRAPYMHWKVLRAMWSEITGAHQVDVRFIKHKSQVLFYVTKYIGKALHAFEGCKRWWRSHNYNVIEEAPFKKRNYGRPAYSELKTLKEYTAELRKRGVFIIEDKPHRVRWRLSWDTPTFEQQAFVEAKRRAAARKLKRGRGVCA